MKEKLQKIEAQLEAMVMDATRDGDLLGLAAGTLRFGDSQDRDRVASLLEIAQRRIEASGELIDDIQMEIKQLAEEVATLKGSTGVAPIKKELGAVA